MDQELLEIVMKSLNQNKEVSLIDQAFLQVGFLRKEGYDIVLAADIKEIKKQQLKLEKEVISASAEISRLIKLNNIYQQQIEEQQLMVNSLQVEIKALKN